MKRRRNIIQRIIGVLVLLIAGSAVTLMSCASFGAKVSGQRLERVKASRHSQDGKFLNALPLSSVGWGEIWDFLGERLFGDQLRHPPSAIPIVSVQPGDFTTPPPPGLRAMWIGHSSVLVELDGVRFLVDPVFSEYASPFQWIGPKRFQPPPIRLEDLPPIAAVLTSHDHYDHLDMHTVQHLAAKGTHFFCTSWYWSSFRRVERSSKPDHRPRLVGIETIGRRHVRVYAGPALLRAWAV